MEHPSLPGWNVSILHFDYGARRSVAVDNGLEGEHRRCNAVRIPDDSWPDDEAIERAMPILAEWAK